MPYYVSNGKVYLEDQSSNKGTAFEVSGATPGGTYGNTALPSGVKLINQGQSMVTDSAGTRKILTPTGLQLELPDPSSPGGTGTGGLSDLGISTSRPAVNREDITSQTQKELGGRKDIIGKSYEQRIAETQGLGEEQKKQLGAELGTNRRFSSSAKAFISYIDDKYKKEVANLELQKEEALSNFDFQMASLIDKRVAQARQEQQQDFDNAIKLFDLQQKQEEAKLKQNAGLITSSRQSAIIGLIDQGIEDPGQILQTINFDDSGKQVGDITLKEITDVLGSIPTRNDLVIADALGSGLKNPVDVYKAIRAKGRNVPITQIAEVMTKLNNAEKTIQGVVGEWLAAKENDPQFADFTLDDYAEWKDPAKALDIKERKLRIQKIEKELNGNGMLDGVGKIVPNQEKVQQINKEIVSNDAYKAIRKGQDSLQFLLDFEKTFKDKGLGTLPGPAKAKLQTTYQTTLLNLKEFFNLGVLNGPDLSVLKGIIPDPTENPTFLGFVPYPKTFVGRGSQVDEGIKNMKVSIEKTLDERYQSLLAQYGDYSPSAVGSLGDLNRIYVQQKAQVNPEVKKLLNENPNLTVDEVIQIIQ